MSSVHRDPNVRASDADRDRVAELLREHVSTGRITMEEFGDRLERCYAAQTYGDLDALVADLPARDPYAGLPVAASTPNYADRPPAPRPAGRLERRHGRFAGGWAPWASASVICWGVWLAGVITSGDVQGLWPIWVTVPWGGVLLARELTAGGDGSGDHPDQRRLDR